MSVKYNITDIHETLKEAIDAVPSIGCEFDKVFYQDELDTFSWTF